MGRYMRKAKREKAAAAAEGVRTRARAREIADSGAYLQLRSRRLEKRVAPLEKRREEGGAHRGKVKEEERKVEALVEEEERSCRDLGVEASFGENILLEGEGGGGDRSTRETTPCSLIRTSDTIATPGSTTRRRNSSAANPRIQSATPRIVPTSQELEEFFASSEQDEIRLFIEKYNFDPVTETPLPGRFEWEKVNP